MRGILATVSLLVLLSMPISASAEIGHEPFIDFAKELAYHVIAGQEPTRLAYTEDVSATTESKAEAPKSYGYAVCKHPQPTGCKIDRNPSMYSSDYVLLTWKAFIKRRIGIRNPKVIGIIFDPIDEDVIVYYTFTK